MHQLESFFWGILAALGALLFEFIAFLFASMQQKTLDYSATDFLALPAMIILTAAAEEIMKLLVISKRVETFSVCYSFIFNSMLVGLGFAMVEIFLIKEFSLHGSQDLLSLIMITIIHISTSAYLGYRVAIHARNKARFIICTLMIAILIHALYNGIISINHPLSNVIAITYSSCLILFIISLLFKIKTRLA